MVRPSPICPDCGSYMWATRASCSLRVRGLNERRLRGPTIPRGHVVAERLIVGQRVRLLCLCGYSRMYHWRWVRPASSKQALSDEQKRQVVLLYTEYDFSTPQIANKFHVSNATVRKALHSHEVTLTKRGRRQQSPELHRQLKLLEYLYVERGLLLREIAALTGVPAGTWRSRLSIAGIPQRPRSESNRLGAARKRGERTLEAIVESLAA